ncbi:MAG: exosortase-associated EpsI family protein [Verrucomicrobia bacterium]|nr:exosortase-associated EpsI family protein [Verrucomicrobiota bacterium]
MQAREVSMLVVLAMVAATATIVSRPGEIVIQQVEGIATTLPAVVGDYQSRQQWFCQSDACLRAVDASVVSLADPCPTCGGKLDDVTLAERQILPADTVIRKTEYVHPDGTRLYVSLVLSGAEQKSMHRPQQCLPAQGYTIDADRVLAVPLTGREPLSVMLLDLRRSGGPVDRRTGVGLASFAYWFVSGERETPSHWQRLLWMSSDRMFRGVAHRWAYIAVSTRRLPSSEGHIDTLREFIADFYPALLGG